jgi:hypothetical protein
MTRKSAILGVSGPQQAQWVVMLDEPHGRFTKLVTVGDLTTARVLAARLEAEGIDVRLHSESFGPYPVTVGSLAEAELWIMDDRMADARAILLDAEVNAALSRADPDAPPPSRGLPFEIRLAALGLGLVLTALWVLRIVRMF